MGSWQKNSKTAMGWKCKVCEADNWAKHKVCWVCKGMRSYVDVAWSATAPGAKQKQSGVRALNAGQALHQQLAAIASQLGEVVANDPHASQDVVMTSQEPASVASTQMHATQDQEAEKQQQIAKIKQLETSLLSVPDGPECKHIRDAISQQITTAKAKINSSKPLAVRLEGCQAAVERARKRLAAAESLAKSAVAAQEVAANEVNKYQAELNEVQVLMSRQLQTAQNGTCLEQLHGQMQSIISEMASSAHVEVSDTQQAIQKMSALINQLTSIAAKSQATAAATATVPGPEQQRLQQMLIENAAAQPVEPILQPIPMPLTAVAAVMGEPSAQVITGGG